jgi:hypothetical protein
VFELLLICTEAETALWILPADWLVRLGQMPMCRLA